MSEERRKGRNVRILHKSGASFAIANNFFDSKWFQRISRQVADKTEEKSLKIGNAKLPIEMNKFLLMRLFTSNFRYRTMELGTESLSWVDFTNDKWSCRRIDLELFPQCWRQHPCLNQ
jgi:hypothetical protein